MKAKKIMAESSSPVSPVVPTAPQPRPKPAHLWAILLMVATGVLGFTFISKHNYEQALIKIAEVEVYQAGVNPLVAAAKVENENAFKGGEVLVKFKAGITDKDKQKFLKTWGVKEKKKIAKLDVRVLEVPEGSEQEMVDALTGNPLLDFVEVNGILSPAVVPNDPYYPSEWNMALISAPQGWDISTGSPDVIIAIVDCGVDPAEDYASRMIPGYNFVSNNGDTHSFCGHGTWVTGPAAATGNEGIGMAGVDWNAKIMPLVMAEGNSVATWDYAASAFIYAVDHGAKVINFSWGGGASFSIENAVNYAWNKGVTIVASAGNSANTTPVYPAAYAKVIGVSATDSNDNLASFSSFGSTIDVAAPGLGVPCTLPGAGIAGCNGTSFSAPQVAGLASLLYAVNPGLTNQQVFDLIRTKTDDIGAPGFDNNFGNGRINVAKTLTAAQSVVPTPKDTTAPSVSITSPTANQTVSGMLNVAVNAADNVGVARVELFKDGAVYGTSINAPYAFSVDTTRETNAAHSLLAKAYDAAGNVTSSAAVSVTVSNVADAVLPTVTITKPLNNSSISARGNNAVSVTASDNIKVTQIYIYVDNVLKATCSLKTVCTYSINVKKVSVGTHSIMAKALDAAGNTATTSVTVTR